MFRRLVDAFKDKDLRKKIFITIGLILIYRLGCWIVVPGLDPIQFKNSLGVGEELTFMNLLNSISGGALANGAIFALGISPYISSSIIIQLLTLVIPGLQRLSRMGEEGKQKMSAYTKYCALILALIQSIAIVLSYQSIINTEIGPAWLVSIMVVLILVAGSMATYWLGEKITEMGISNGQSLLIFVGILSTFGNSLYAALFDANGVFSGNMDMLLELVYFIVALIVIFGFIVFMDMGERKIPVQYAKQIKGRKMYGGQSTYIPIKVNSTGVMPIIFAMTFISLPQILISLFAPNSQSGFAKFINEYIGTQSWLYFILMAVFIIGFAYFWAQITFNPVDVSKNIQQNGGFIPGIRPGKATADYLKKISNRITLFGAIFLALIAMIPSIIFKIIGTGTLVNAFSATGLLIVVSVAIELDKQLEAQMLMKNYKGFLK
ncbi:MAG: preprotein translocase subunit SecY [Clostridiales bacterium]|nr:preprotein translocase subunit SecY [Clostridiales bacterium]